MIDYDALAQQHGGIDYDAYAKQFGGNVQNDISQPQQPQENFLQKLGSFFGMKPLGESIARGIYNFTKGPQDLPAKEAFGKEAPTTGQVIGSALQTAALATPFEGLNALSKLEVGGKLLGSTAGKLGLMGAASGAGSALENQGTAGQVLGQGITGAGIGLATAGLGAGIQKLGKFMLGTGETGGLPARLMGNIFKTSTDEQLADAYKIVNGEAPPPTLRGIALREHMAGSNQEMLVHSAGMIQNLEGQLQEAAQGQTVKLANKSGYIEALKTIAGNIEKTSFGTEPQALQQANELISKIKAKGNTFEAADILGLKRFLDDQRTHSSFLLDTNLAPKQQGIKALADNARAAIKDQVPQAAELLGKQRDFIRLRDAIVKDSVKRENKQILGLSDALLLGGGSMIPHGLGSGLGAEAVMRGFQEPGAITRFANLLNQAGQKTQQVPSIGGGRALQKFLTTQGARTF